MGIISEKIDSVNRKNEKTLTVFLTAGYPYHDNFVELIIGVANAGADLIEIGLPFGDSLADGPVIQASYTVALENGINLNQTLNFVKLAKEKIDIPIILMSSSNPILYFGKQKFCVEAKESKIDGLIIPDIPLEEYDDFYTSEFDKFDKILLTTPTSSESRIISIDKKSTGFVYCVSVVGTTGVRQKYEDYVFDNLKRTYNTIEKNKMQIGFGISSPENVKQFSPFCDGVIVGSAIIKSLENDNKNFTNTFKLVAKLKEACK
jgi:tryptophan synthase alpha chain